MQRWKRLVVLLLLLLAAYTFGYRMATFDTIEPEPVQTVYDIGVPTDDELLELTNYERMLRGIPPLQPHDALANSAQLKADDFRQRDYFSHNVKGTDNLLSPEMSNYLDPVCVRTTENLASAASSSQATIDGWMDSQTHREAILDPNLSLIGFGITNNPNWLNGYYVVQHMCIAR